jgi:hypothetical protein
MRRENWRGGSAILDAWCHVGRARVPQISISNHLVRFSADLMPPLFRPSRFFFFSFEREENPSRGKLGTFWSFAGWVLSGGCGVQGGAGTDVDPP